MHDVYGMLCEGHSIHQFGLPEMTDKILKNLPALIGELI